MFFTHIVVLTAALLALPVAAQVSTPEFDLTEAQHFLDNLHLPAWVDLNHQKLQKTRYQ